MFTSVLVFADKPTKWDSLKKKWDSFASDHLQKRLCVNWLLLFGQIKLTKINKLIFQQDLTLRKTNKIYLY